MRTILLFFVFFNTWANAQKNNYTEHKVLAKETVFSIAKKYDVTAFDIYRLLHARATPTRLSSLFHFLQYI